MDWLTLIGYTGAALAAASTGAVFSPGAWYEALDKPGWTPPNWLFPIAWTALYAAMIYAVWRVSGLTDNPMVRPALAFWTFQIALNAVWTPVFFGMRSIGGGVVVIAFLWTAVVGTTLLFLATDPVAGLLLVPYVIWVSYAAALNVDIWRRNRTA